MRYACRSCTFATHNSTEATQHSEQPGHVVDVHPAPRDKVQVVRDALETAEGRLYELAELLELTYAQLPTGTGALKASPQFWQARQTAAAAAEEAMRAAMAFTHSGPLRHFHDELVKLHDQAQRHKATLEAAVAIHQGEALSWNYLNREDLQAMAYGVRSTRWAVRVLRRSLPKPVEEVAHGQ